MAEKIGDVVLELKTDSKRFDRGIKKAGKQTDRLNRKMDRAKKTAMALKTKLIAVGAALIAGYALTKAITKVTDLGDKIAKMSKRTGVATETLSAFRLVMKLGGASIDSFAKGMKTMSKMMFDIRGGAGAEAKKAFEDIRVEVTRLDGSLRDPLELFYEVADAFSKMEDGARKSAVAQTIFGRAGLDLIPTLNMGSDAIREQAELADKLGYSFSRLEGKEMEDFTDAVEILKTALFALWQNLVIYITPALTTFAEKITALILFFKEHRTAATLLHGTLTVLMTPLALIPTKMGEVAKGMASASEKAKELAEETRKLTEEKLKALTAEEKLANKLAKLQPENEKKYLKDTKEMLKRINDEHKEALLLHDETRTDLENLETKIARIDYLYNANKISLDTHTRAIKKAAKEFNKLGDTGEDTFSRMKTAVEGWASGFSATLNDMLWGAELTFGNILQSFGKMITQMLLQIHVVEPLLGGVLKAFSPSSLFGGATVGGQPFTSSLEGATISPDFKDYSSLNVPYVSKQHGGIVTKPTFATLAEREPEIVAPLSQLAGLGGGGNNNVEVNVIGVPEGTRTEESRTSGGMRKIDVILDEKVANNIRSGTKTFSALTKTFGNLSPQLVGR